MNSEIKFHTLSGVLIARKIEKSGFCLDFPMDTIDEIDSTVYCDAVKIVLGDHTVS